MIWEQRKYNFEAPVTVPGLITLVLPTYNRKKFLPERLKDIFSQTYTNWELIVVNDGGENVEDFFKGYNNIKYINLEENSKSVSIPRNIGISYARGEFIAPVDDDVKLLPDKLELLVNNIGASSLCYGNRTDINLINGVVKPGKRFPEWNPLERSGVDNGQLIYRKSVYEKINYVVSTHACDYHLSREIYKKFGSFKYIEPVVCEYYWHDNNRSLSENRKNVPLLIQNFKKYFNVHNEVLIVREQ